jgi:CheY-like chemotaxis protein
MGKIKVLVVDDDKKFCKDLGNIIKIWFGCDITISYLGSDAVALIEKEVFHVVLIDLKMPGIDGFMVLEMAMKKYPNVIPFAVSGVNEIGVTKRV